jgi:hypothetical protein
VIETMSSRLLRLRTGVGGNLDWREGEPVEEKAYICLGPDGGLPVQSMQVDEVVEPWHSRPDQGLRQRHRMVPDAAGSIDAVSEQRRRRRDCARLVGGRKDLETMDVGIGRREAGCRGGAGLLSTSFVR